MKIFIKSTLITSLSLFLVCCTDRDTAIEPSDMPTEVTEETRINYKFTQQKQVIEDQQVIDDMWGLIGSQESHNTFHLAYPDGVNKAPVFKFWIDEGRNRIELTEAIAKKDDAKDISPEMLENLSILAGVDGLVSVGEYGDTIKYTWKTYFPEKLTKDSTGIFAQWHGRPDKTLVKTPEGIIKKLNIDEFVELSKKVKWKQFKDNAGGRHGLDSETGEKTGYIVDGAAGGPIGEFIIKDGHLLMYARNNAGVLSVSSRPRLKVSRSAPTMKRGIDSAALIVNKPISEVPIKQWIQFEVEIAFAEYNYPEDGVKSEGGVKVWMDGQLITDWKGPIGKNDYQGPYFKFGVYKPGKGGFSVWHKEFQKTIVKKGPIKKRTVRDHF